MVGRRALDPPYTAKVARRIKVGVYFFMSWASHRVSTLSGRHLPQDLGEVVLQNDIPSRRAALDLPQPVEWLRYHGSFPQFSLTGVQCACDLVGSGGHSLVHVTAVVDGLLHQQDVKRIRLKWHWIGEGDESTNEVRLSSEEFNQRNVEEQLQPNTWYRVNDPTKYQHLVG
jgi:hypothetical protein